jgi:hypothetical protein
MWCLLRHGGIIITFIEIKPKTVTKSFIEFKPEIKNEQTEIFEYVSTPEVRNKINKEELEKKLKLYKDTVADLLNIRNSLKLHCEKCIEDKIFCSNCNIDFLMVRIERILERCY